MSNFFNVDSVSHNTVRSWILRLSYGLLFKTEIEKRDDWIYIIDFSNQLSSQRCLLILAVPYEHFKNNNFILQHKDMTVVDIYVKDRTNGDLVNERLKFASERTGLPYQIISDGGPDVKKGVNNFIECTSPKTIFTNDMTHKIALHLKHILEPNEEWNELSKDLRSIAQQTKQSDAAFLRPVSMRKKSRWLNVDRISYWLKNIYKYESREDFSLLEKNFGLSEDFVGKIINNKNEQRKLLKKTFKTKEEVKNYISKFKLSSSVLEKLELIDLGEKYFKEKFEKIDSHKKFAEELEEMINVSDIIKTKLKKDGLSNNTISELEKSYNSKNIIHEKTQILFQNIIQSLNEQIRNFSTNIIKPQLCVSDIIESIFGKFKVQLTNAVGGIYATVLNIVLICNNFTIDKIHKILNETKLNEVQNWFEMMSGKSIQYKRNIAFNKKI